MKMIAVHRYQKTLLLMAIAILLGLLVSPATAGDCDWCDTYPVNPADDKLVCRAYAGKDNQGHWVGEDGVRGQIFIWEAVMFTVEGRHTSLTPKELGRPTIESWTVTIRTPWGNVVQRYHGNPIYISWDRTIKQADGSVIVATIGEYPVDILARNETAEWRECDSDWGPWKKWRFVVPIPYTMADDYRSEYEDGRFPYDLVQEFYDDYLAQKVAEEQGRVTEDSGVAIPEEDELFSSYLEEKMALESLGIGQIGQEESQ